MELIQQTRRKAGQSLFEVFDQAGQLTSEVRRELAIWRDELADVPDVDLRTVYLQACALWERRYPFRTAYLVQAWTTLAASRPALPTHKPLHPEECEFFAQMIPEWAAANTDQNWAYLAELQNWFQQLASTEAERAVLAQLNQLLDAKQINQPTTGA